MFNYRIITAVMAMALGSMFAESLTWKIDYDDRDRPVRRIDPAGRATLYAYTETAAGRLESIRMTPPDTPPVSWRFDDRGRLAGMTDGEGTVTYRYDTEDRLTAVQRQDWPAVAYTYDDAGRLATLAVGDVYRVAWEYDYLGRIVAMATPAGTVRYEYWTGQNKKLRILPNGVRTFWEYQPNGVLKQISHVRPVSPDSGQYALLAQYTYQYGPDGRIAAIEERSATGTDVKRYTYDTMGHLTAATSSAGQSYRYEYDQLGNRTRAIGATTRTCTYDWAGRLTTVNGTPCTYDANGNLAEVTLDGVPRTYSYHPDGHLAAAEVGGEETVRYRYDGFGRLVERVAKAGGTRFIPDPLSSIWQPLMIVRPGGKRTLLIWDGSIPLALVREGEAEWLLHDHLGSVRMVTGRRGETIRRCTYEPFGETGGDEDLQPGLGGVFWDREGHAYLTAARAYHPDLGQFLQPDPQKSIPGMGAGGFAVYSYCDADPVNYLDLDGAERFPYDWRNLDHLQQGMEELNQGRPIPDGWYKVQNAMGGPSWFAEHTLWLRGVDAALVHENLVRIDGGRVTWVEGFYNSSGAFSSRSSSSDIKSSTYSEGSRGITPSPNEPIVGMERISDVTDASMFAGIKKARSGRFAPDAPWRLSWNGISGYWLIGNQCQDFASYVAKNAQAFERTARNATTSSGGSHVSGLAGAGAWPDRAPVPYRRNDPVWDGGHKPMIWGDDRPPPGGGGLLSASNVGGVYLGGAGKALAGIGQLQGVRVDDNGQLVLVGSEGGETELPPLRLDDVVTIFRSVYLHGHGPSVTIDPNPENPEKSAMIIRHGEGTEDTYVGWVLYQADRLMKGYTLGTDNVTQQDVVSAVPGYQDVLQTIYFGGADPRQAQREGIWERFWIVPAGADRFESPVGKLTLLDVPLEVRTQKMIWKNGDLVDDPTGQSSPGARQFTEWFTANYDGIAAEQSLTPPAAAGLAGKVPVFAELRRIALLTGVAEKLRDDGVPMPFWMRDYEVRPVPFEKFTPGLEITKERDEGDGIRQARIFGGVQLSPENRAVRTFAQGTNVVATPEAQARATSRIALAADLERAIERTPTAAPPLTVVDVGVDGKQFKAAAVPGANSRALGPCRLVEEDVAVPVGQGRHLRLARRYHSFFAPRGPWGQSWTLDLPRLDPVVIPVQRERSRVTTTRGYDLVTPLNSFSARFDRQQEIPEFGGSRLLATARPSPFYGVGADRPDFLKDAQTNVVYLKDGRQWHFAESGRLVATVDGPVTTVYERDETGRVTRLVGVLGRTLAATIDLDYAPDGRLARARGATTAESAVASEATYEYDATGHLARTTTRRGTSAYSYDGTLVTSVATTTAVGAAATATQFAYNEHGQLTMETRGDHRQRCEITATADGVQMAVVDAESGQQVALGQFNMEMMPVQKTVFGGPTTTWDYPADGSVTSTTTAPDGQATTVTTSPDGRQQTVRTATGEQVVTRFDDGGRVVGVERNGRQALAREWRPDGQVAKVRAGGAVTDFRYGDDALLSGMIRHPETAGTELSEWQETEVDPQGRPLAVRDNAGLKVHYAYDRRGNLTAAVQTTADGNLGYNIERNDQGRVTAVKSSWGDTMYDYRPTGELERVRLVRGDQAAWMEVADGRVREIVGFDRGCTEFHYAADPDPGDPPESITCANGLTIAFTPDDAGGIATAALGDQRRVRLERDVRGRVTMYAWEPLAAR